MIQAGVRAFGSLRWKLTLSYVLVSTSAFVPVPNPLGPIEGGKQRFAVAFKTAAEAQAVKGKPLTLTLVSDRGSTQTVWKLAPQS